MGQAMMRMMTYDRAANERNALPALSMAGHSLKWFRLDDGVMGGQSETMISSSGAGAATSSSTDAGSTCRSWLEFKGTINTNGGGFASIRARLEDDNEGTASTVFTASTNAIQLLFRGDGKTYKVLLSDGKQSTGGPFAKSPSWQADLPTQKRLKDDDDDNNNNNSNNEWQQATIPLTSFRPSFGPRSVSDQDLDKYTLDATEIRELGLMLSLKLSNGQPNPVETFGEGIFPFFLQVKSIEPVTTTL